RPAARAKRRPAARAKRRPAARAKRVAAVVRLATSSPRAAEAMPATIAALSAASRVRREQRARAAVAATFIAHGVLIGPWAPRIPEIKSQLGLSAGALGIALLAPALGTVLAAR